MRTPRGASESAVLRDALSLVVDVDELPSVHVIGSWSKVEKGDVWRWVTREIMVANDHQLPRIKPPRALARLGILGVGGMRKTPKPPR